MNWQPLLNELGQWQQIGRIVTFWWRDDDAISDTPALRTLLTITDPFPIAIAVIPAKCDVTLSGLLASYSRVAIFQHGWRHLKIDGQLIEFPATRNSKTVLAELQAGHTILTELFGAQFLPVMVPPYHGWSNDFTSLLEVTGLIGFSVKGATPSPRRTFKVVNVHIEPIVWSVPPTLGDPDVHIAAIVAELQQRRSTGSTEPIGVLTHHLSHDAATMTFCEELAGILKVNPAVVVVHPATLFMNGNDNISFVGW